MSHFPLANARGGGRGEVGVVDRGGTVTAEILSVMSQFFQQWKELPLAFVSPMVARDG